MLDTGSPELAADIGRMRQGQVGETIYGVLCAILQLRRCAHAGPVTLLSCDNLRHNGDRLRAGLRLAQPLVAANWNPQGYGANPINRIAVLVG